MGWPADRCKVGTASAVTLPVGTLGGWAHAPRASAGSNVAASDRPRPWHYTALQLSLAGADPKQVAAQLERTLASVRKLLDSEWAATELARWHQAVMLATAKDRIDPIRRFQGLVDRAITKVEQKMECGDDKVELLAAQRILDNAGLSVVKRVEVSEDAALRDLTPAQMAEVARTGRLPAAKVVLAIEGAI